ncbi:MAG: GNAT family N-acetyltransferase [Phycisphaerae bacterium]|nr:GNAT family N-acetyltransferase [Phycisphaerae bacterium]
MSQQHAIQIRIATRADLSAIASLARAAFTLDAFSDALLAEKLFDAPLPDAELWQTYLAERDGRLIGFMQSVVRRGNPKAWVGLFAVDAGARRQGIARRLFEHTRSAWPSRITSAEILALPGNYFAPGLDPRYTTGLSFVEALGFTRGRDCVNLSCKLWREFDTAAEESRLTAQGIEIRRADRRSDGPLLDAFFASDFGADWRFEAEQALRQSPEALHLALRPIDGQTRIVAFSAHTTQNREWGFFGPMGTTPAARGLGLGRVLLWRCLNDMRAAGHQSSVIPWVGPIRFYHDACGAVVERVFWRYQMELVR